MRRLARAAFVFAASITLVSGSVADTPSVGPSEISYLLGFVARSGCAFYRNGSRYEAPAAESHLREKYEALASAGKVATAEEFIDRVASSSSLTGRPYEVSCANGERIPTREWLRDALAEYRAAEAPRDMRGAS